MIWSVLQLAFIRKETLIWDQKCEVTYFSFCISLREMHELAEQHSGPGTFLLPLGGHFGVVGELQQSQAFFSGTVWGQAGIVGSTGNPEVSPGVGGCLQPAEREVQYVPTVPAAHGNTNVGNHTRKHRIS